MENSKRIEMVGSLKNQESVDSLKKTIIKILGEATYCLEDHYKYAPKDATLLVDCLRTMQGYLDSEIEKSVRLDNARTWWKEQHATADRRNSLFVTQLNNAKRSNYFDDMNRRAKASQMQVYELYAKAGITQIPEWHDEQARIRFDSIHLYGYNNATFAKDIPLIDRIDEPMRYKKVTGACVHTEMHSEVYVFDGEPEVHQSMESEVYEQ